LRYKQREVLGRDEKMTTGLKATMLHKTAQERYEKLKNVFARLKKNLNRDDLDDFIQTANSLREWIRRDTTMTLDQRAALERFVVPESLDWQICNQIANQQKHVAARPRTKARHSQAGSVPSVKAVDVQSGGTGFVVPPSMRVVGAGEEITIVHDGGSESALAFVVRTFRHFHYIFEVAPFPPEERARRALTADILRC
jgi:hypothetical protein